MTKEQQKFIRNTMVDNMPQNTLSNTPDLQPEILRRLRTIQETKTDIERWANPKQLEAAWNVRTGPASSYILSGSIVLDLGCGAMALEKALPYGCTYIPCDVVARDHRTHVCNFNEGEFPKVKTDIITILGVLEYIYDPLAFFTSLHRYNCPIVISYHPAEMSQRTNRSALGWVNSLSRTEFLLIAQKAGFTLHSERPLDAMQFLYKFIPVAKPIVKTKKVLVLSYNNVGNFGDRLGYHLVNQILPAHAITTFANFKPWNIPQEDFDLVILGIGNSIFGNMYTDQLLKLLEKTPASIGIFGTQYREMMPLERLQTALDRLTFWYARYQEDIQLYGRNRNNVRHLGDWLINAFPIGNGYKEEVLHIGDKIWKELPLDRTI
ncbi:MAG: Methyltransferase FkbM family [Chlamydiales bacterium]|jgi:hypothetical protein|nr:Methyltransferase FkbM family [Chlamydiales bacterium]